MKKTKRKITRKIDWEDLFESSSSTEEAMYYFVFGRYDIDEFEEACNVWIGLGDVYDKVFEKMHDMGQDHVREDCKKWMRKAYGPNHYEETLAQYCTCHDCPIHVKEKNQ